MSCSPRGAEHGVLGQIVSALALSCCALLGQFAVYRARRYRLTRTVYRGMRFHQNGSAWRYAVCAVFWWAMIALTLGLAYPFAQSQPRALQDAPHVLWRSAGPFRRLRHAAVLPRLADVVRGGRSARLRCGLLPSISRRLGRASSGGAKAAASKISSAGSMAPIRNHGADWSRLPRLLSALSWRRCSIRCSRRWCCAGGSPACASAR